MPTKRGIPTIGHYRGYRSLPEWGHYRGYMRKEEEREKQGTGFQDARVSGGRYGRGAGPGGTRARHRRSPSARAIAPQRVNPPWLAGILTAVAVSNLCDRRPRMARRCCSMSSISSLRRAVLKSDRYRGTKRRAASAEASTVSRDRHRARDPVAAYSDLSRAFVGNAASGRDSRPTAEAGWRLGRRS
jgi:hypothetical protein